MEAAWSIRAAHIQEEVKDLKEEEEVGACSGGRDELERGSANVCHSNEEGIVAAQREERNKGRVGVAQELACAMTAVA